MGCKRVPLGTLEVGEVLGDDLALLAQGARQHVDVVPTSHVVRQRDAGGQGLVVRVCVHEEQPGTPPAQVESVEEALHGATAMSANSMTPPAMVFADRLRTSDPAT